MSELTHISSLLIQAHPSEMGSVQRAVATLPGVEVQANDPAGKIVVTVETAAEQSLMETIDGIGRMDGVVNVLLVYHHAENLNAEN